MSELRKFVDDMFYANIGAAVSLKDKMTEKFDEFIDKGKNYRPNNTDMNRELKHNKEESKERDAQSILNELTTEEKRALKEALMNEQE